MARPINKQQLLDVSQGEYHQLIQLLEGIPTAEIERPVPPGGWSIKDVIAHLSEWHRMFFHWYEEGLHGGTPAVPAAGYKWSQLPALNQAIFEKYRSYAWNDILASFHNSHQRTVELIEQLPEQDLFAAGLYKWMNKNMLVAYFHANTTAHYTWARAEIKKKLRPAP